MNFTADAQIIQSQVQKCFFLCFILLLSTIKPFKGEKESSWGSGRGSVLRSSGYWRGFAQQQGWSWTQTAEADYSWGTQVGCMLESAAARPFDTAPLKVPERKDALSGQATRITSSPAGCLQVQTLQHKNSNRHRSVMTFPVGLFQPFVMWSSAATFHLVDANTKCYL